MTLSVVHLFPEKVNFGDHGAFFMSRFMVSCFTLQTTCPFQTKAVIISTSSGVWDAAGYI